MIGLITYDYWHLKTEQVVQSFLRKGYDFRIYALPFVYRPRRKVLFSHRPEQTAGVRTELMARSHRIDYMKCASDSEIDNSCDIYHILGAGILSAECIKGKRIINCHPGIIPAVRGLDAFKWAIYDMLPTGVTLHYIDVGVDRGEIIAVVPTNVYEMDTIERLARRHYENEIEVISNCEYYLANPVNQYEDTQEGGRHMRMDTYQESMMLDLFDQYVAAMK